MRQGFFQVFSPFIFLHQFSSFFSVCKCCIWQNKYCIVLYAKTADLRQMSDNNSLCGQCGLMRFVRIK